VVDTDKGLLSTLVNGKKVWSMQIKAGERAWEILTEIIRSIRKGDPPFDKIKPQTFVVDSITALSDLMDMELTRYPRSEKSTDGEVMSLPDFRVHRRRTFNLIRYTQDLKMNVVVTANTTLIKDDLSGRTYELPIVAGQDAKRELAAMFDEVYLLEYDDKEKVYLLHTKPHGAFKQAKSRKDLPETIEDPSYEKLNTFYKKGRKQTERK
jgi:hypothetical protein